MGDLTPPLWVDRGDGVHLAARHRAGTGSKPTLVFLPGYASDMQGSKALALDAWAAETGYGLLRLDYSGCGESQGRFEDGTLAQWRDDALTVINHIAPGPVVLIGSSMGGWIALLLAQALGARVKGLIGIAAAPDFTQWGFSVAEKAQMASAGRLLRPSDYGPEPMLMRPLMFIAPSGCFRASKTQMCHGTWPCALPPSCVQPMCSFTWSKMAITGCRANRTSAF
jgi:pimeloyl-ACP methyl ester carboxylesterase